LSLNLRSIFVTHWAVLAPFLGILLVSMAALEASAEDESPNYSAEGAYLGAGIVFGFPTILGDELASGRAGSVDVDNSIGATGKLGYRFSELLAAELHYDYLTDFKARSRIPGNSERLLANIQAQTFTANAKAYLLGRERIQSYASAGIGLMDATTKDASTLFDPDIDDTAFVARFGFGIDFYINEYVSFFTDVAYIIPTDALQDLQYVSIAGGVTAHFR
jgi:opacity protein-like surface antigen